MYWTFPNVLNIPWRTHDIPLMYVWYPPMYSWYPRHASWHPSMYWTSPNVLMIPPPPPPRCTHGVPLMYWTPPMYTHDILPMYSWYPPDVLNSPGFVLMISSWCTHGIPPMYWTHIIQCDKTIQHVSEPNLKLFEKRKQGYGPIKLEDFLLLCSY